MTKNNIQLFNDDCFNVLPKLIEDNVKVNMVFADLPYGETGNVWDNKINLTLMFDYLKELITEDGTILFTGTFKFGTLLYNVCPELYKYDWVWQKEHGTNFPSVNYQPFRNHEFVFVYGKGRVSPGKRTPMKYYPQKTKGKPYTTQTGTKSTCYKGGVTNITTVNQGDRHPKTIQFFKRDKGQHPTQKPVSMIEYFIKTYTDENDIVLDFTMGSGSTGVACQNLNRKFIGVELNEEYYNIAVERIFDKQTKLI
jgi:site-specific DNA-methyltransferase (adenine-specific)